MCLWLFILLCSLDLLYITFVYPFLAMESENDLCFNFVAQLTYVNELQLIVRLHFYDFHVNEVIALTLVTQTFYPSYPNIFYSTIVYPNSCIDDPLRFL